MPGTHWRASSSKPIGCHNVAVAVDLRCQDCAGDAHAARWYSLIGLYKVSELCPWPLNSSFPRQPVTFMRPFVLVDQLAEDFVASYPALSPGG